jgi:hypothetical protein
VYAVAQQGQETSCPQAKVLFTIGPLERSLCRTPREIRLRANGLARHTYDLIALITQGLAVIQAACRRKGAGSPLLFSLGILDAVSSREEVQFARLPAQMADYSESLRLADIDAGNGFLTSPGV